MSLFPANASELILGGLLIGCSAGILLLSLGRILGVSGIASKVVANLEFSIVQLLQIKKPKELQKQFSPKLVEGSHFWWRFYFVAGLICGGYLLKNFSTVFNDISYVAHNPFIVCLSGLLVGFGSRLGLGCTSGHGVCGMGRLSGRSLLATITYVCFGILTAAVFHFLKKKLFL